MNIDTFETSQVSSHAQQNDSFASDEALAIKQKIHQRKGKQKKLKIILGLGVSLIFILMIAVLYSQYKLHLLAEAEKQSEVTKNSIPKTGEEVIKALTRHILVPQGVPQIAEVKDASKLRETQAFFKDVEAGDVVVVYDTTIFVYRPSKDIVVASGDISGTGQLKP
jgi:hypothetical protein